jgi:hypothetical protein
MSLRLTNAAEGEQPTVSTVGYITGASSEECGPGWRESGVDGDAAAVDAVESVRG